MTTIDPVCGWKIEEKGAEYRSAFHGKNYYFCGSECKTSFDNNPSKYI